MADLTYKQADLVVTLTDETNTAAITAAGAVLVDGSAAIATSTTATLSSVAGNLSSVSILASNTSRKMAAVFNDSTHNNAVLYLKFGTTASTTSYTVQIPAGSYYEFPTPIYTGAVDGIWSSNATANARITEFT